MAMGMGTYPTAAGAFNRGLGNWGGDIANIMMQKKRMGMLEKQQTQATAQQQFQNDYNIMRANIAIASNTDMPDAARTEAYNAAGSFLSKQAEMKLPPITEWDSKANKFTKKLKAIDDNEGMSLQDKKKNLSYLMAEHPNQEAVLKIRIADIEKQKQKEQDSLMIAEFTRGMEGEPASSAIPPQNILSAIARNPRHPLAMKAMENLMSMRGKETPGQKRAAELGVFKEREDYRVGLQETPGQKLRQYEEKKKIDLRYKSVSTIEGIYAKVAKDGMKSLSKNEREVIGLRNREDEARIKAIIRLISNNIEYEYGTPEEKIRIIEETEKKYGLIRGEGGELSKGNLPKDYSNLFNK